MPGAIGSFLLLTPAAEALGAMCPAFAGSFVASFAASLCFSGKKSLCLSPETSDGQHLSFHLPPRNHIELNMFASLVI